MASYGDWLSKKMQGATNAAGNAVGGVFTAAGNGVSGAGRGVGNAVSGTSRGWADGLRNYGNAIKDASGASGPRAATASNPLGMTGTKSAKALMGGGGGTAPRKGTAQDPLGLNR